MQKISKSLLLVVTMSMFCGCGCDCEPYDDSEIRDKIENLEERMQVVESLLSAMTKELRISSIVDNGDQYILTFSDNSVIQINKDATSSVVSIEQDEVFVYITMQDGSLLTFLKVPNAEYNKIYYTSTDGERVLPDATTSSYGALFIASYYDETNGGVMLFDDNVTKIGGFGTENLQTLTIPETVTEITAYAFMGCRYLKEIYCNIKTPPTVGYEAFKYYNGLGSYYNIYCTVYVPFESVNAYCSATGWSGQEIVGYDFEK